MLNRLHLCQNLYFCPCPHPAFLSSTQDLTQILENNGLPVNDIDDEITKTAESDRQHENGDCETGNQDAQNES